MKKVYRFRPCPSYDAEKMESWLTDMAAKGLVLSEDGFFCGFAAFDKAEPVNRRYRLQPAPKKPTFFGDYNTPGDDEIELYKEYGWNYTGYSGDYFIYYADGDVQELNTEPEVQALAMDIVRRRQRSSLIGMIIEAFILSALNFRIELLMAIAEVGTPFMLALAAMLVWFFVSEFRKYGYCRRLWKRLKNGEEADHAKNWKSGAFRYKFGLCLLIALTVTVIVWTIVLAVNDTKPKESIDAYLDELPYITMKSLAKEGTYEQNNAFYAANEIEHRTDLIVPEWISTAEHADMMTEDGKHISGGMYVDYYDLRGEGMAKMLMWELRHVKHYMKHYKVKEAPQLDADDVFAYYDIFDTVVIRQDNKVIKVEFFQTGKEEIPYAEWTAAAAESIK